MTLKIQDKKDWAKLLFIRENLTQKEIAGKVGVAEKTMSKWVNENNWEQLRSSVIITKSEELRRIYMQINELNTMIFNRDEGQRFANSKEADTLNKLAATARALETEVAIADIIEVFKRFTEWLRSIDLGKAKEIVRLEDDFIRSILK